MRKRTLLAVTALVCFTAFMASRKLFGGEENSAPPLAGETVITEKAGKGARQSMHLTTPARAVDPNSVAVGPVSPQGQSLNNPPRTGSLDPSQGSAIGVEMVFPVEKD